MTRWVREWAGVAIGCVALFTALGGPALATGLISGKQIKAHSITEGNLSVATVKKLRGSTGPRGSQGPAGAQGQDGAAGPTGPTGPQGSPDTAAQVLSKVESVDGAGSGLDADSLDGIGSSGFLKAGDPAGGDLTGRYPQPTLGALPGARVTRASAESVPNSTSTDVTFDSTDFGHGVTTAANALGIQRGGTYLVTAGVVWAPNGTGARSAVISDNEGSVVGDVRPAVSTLNTVQSLATVVHLDSGDLVSLAVDQSSGGPLSIAADDRSYLSVEFLGA